MQTRREVETSPVTVLAFPWLVAFVVLKNISLYAATWSWWWLLMPIVPVIGTFAHRFLL